MQQSALRQTVFAAVALEFEALTARALRSAVRVAPGSLIIVRFNFSTLSFVLSRISFLQGLLDSLCIRSKWVLGLLDQASLQFFLLAVRLLHASQLLFLCIFTLFPYTFPAF